MSFFLSSSFSSFVFNFIGNPSKTCLAVFRLVSLKKTEQQERAASKKGTEVWGAGGFLFEGCNVHSLRGQKGPTFHGGCILFKLLGGVKATVLE